MLVSKRFVQLTALSLAALLLSSCKLFNGSSSTSSYYPSSQYSTTTGHENTTVRRRGSAPSLYQPKEDVNEMNAKVPEKPISDHLPSYGKKKSSDQKAVHKSLQRSEETKTDPAAPPVQ